MTATEELRRMLDERGVDYRFNDATKVFEWHFDGTDGEGSAHATEVDGCINIIACSLTPAQAIAATLGDEGVARSNDGVAELGAGTCRRVYLVEVSDDLIESWCPLSVYLHREAAEDCAEALRKEEGGIRQFARVSELKVVDDG